MRAAAARPPLQAMSPRSLVLLALPALLQCMRDDAFPEGLDVDQLDELGAPVEPPQGARHRSNSSEALAPDMSSPPREVGTLPRRAFPVGSASATIGLESVLLEVSTSLQAVVQAGAAIGKSSVQGLLKPPDPLDEASKALCSSAGPTCKNAVDTLHMSGEEGLNNGVVHTRCLGQECIQQNLDKCKGVLPFLDKLFAKTCSYLKCAEGGEGCKTVVDIMTIDAFNAPCKKEDNECIKKKADHIRKMCSAGSRECILNHSTTCAPWVPLVDNLKAGDMCDRYTCKDIGGDCKAAIDTAEEEMPSPSPCFFNGTRSCDDVLLFCTKGLQCFEKNKDACGMYANLFKALESADECTAATCASQGADCQKVFWLLDKKNTRLNKDDKTFICGEGKSCMEKNKDACNMWTGQVQRMCRSDAPSTAAPFATLSLAFFLALVMRA